MSLDLTQFVSWKSKAYTLDITVGNMMIVDKFFNPVVTFYPSTPKHIIIAILTEFGFKHGGEN